MAKSPEDILIGVEEAGYILDFIDWVKSLMTPEQWELFSMRYMYGKNCREISRITGIPFKNVRYRTKTSMKIVRDMLPYYDFPIREYIKGEME